MRQSGNVNNESDLWLSFVEGSKDAFSVLYRQSYNKLYSYGLRFGATEEQVRDIIHDLFTKLYEKPGLIKDRTTIRPFLFVSVRNACFNLEKAKSKVISIHQVGHFDLEYSIRDDSMTERQEKEHLRQLIEDLLEKLTSRQKEIIYLRFLYQMEYEEISKIMNLSEQAARNLTHRALEKLRKEKPDHLLFVYCLLLSKLL